MSLLPIATLPLRRYVPSEIDSRGAGLKKSSLWQIIILIVAWAMFTPCGVKVLLARFVLFTKRVLTFQEWARNLMKP
jgi:hypothetical protein